MIFDTEYAVYLIKETYSTVVQKLSEGVPPKESEQYLEIRPEQLATQAVIKAAEVYVTELTQVEQVVEDVLKFKET